MPTNDELHEADKVQAAAIAELRTRMKAHDSDIERHEKHLLRLDETVAVLRDGMARVATKDDVGDLRRDISEQFMQGLRDAHKSIPDKVAAVFAGGMFLIACITLFVSLAPKHG